MEDLNQLLKPHRDIDRLEYDYTFWVTWLYCTPEHLDFHGYLMGGEI